MVVIKTMVGEMEIGETNWGDEDKYAVMCREKPPDQSNIRCAISNVCTLLGKLHSSLCVYSIIVCSCATAAWW